MSSRLYSTLPTALALLAASLWTTQAGAQAPAAAPANPVASSALADSAPPAYRSALEGYKPYTDEKIVNWKQANETAAQIGGWREYAKEASREETPQDAVKPAPGTVPVKP